MAFSSQTKPKVMFLCWDELKEGLDADSTVVIQEHENIVGKIVSIEEVDENYKYTLQSKEYPRDILVWGNSALNREMIFGDEGNKDFKPVKEGDKVRITYTGKYKTSQGGTGYGMRVEVDR